MQRHPVSKPINSKCPACGSQCTKPYARPKLLRYDRCADCGSIFRVFAEGDSYPQSQAGYRAAVTGRSALPRRAYLSYCHTARLLEKYVGAADPRLLDVGCGAAQMLYTLADRGFTDLVGVEPNFVHGFSDNLPFEIFSGTLQDLTNQSPPPFDVVVFHHVIEHIEHPVEAIQAAFELVKPDGRVILATPNIGALDKRMRHFLSARGWIPKPWKTLNAPKHVVLFARAGLSRLLRRAGGRVVKIGTWTRRLGAGRVFGPLKDFLHDGGHLYAVAEIDPFQ